MHEFKKSLAFGKKSEEDFYNRWSDKIKPTDGRTGDFILRESGLKLELKTDTYNPSRTENFFMERYSYDTKNGGPWQAAEHGVEYFLYWFPKGDLLYCYKVSELLPLLEELTKTETLIEIQNTSHVTRGYKVPRSALKSIEIDFSKLK